MKIKILLILSIILTLQVKGQDKKSIVGKIIDKDTKENLLGATIVYQKKSIGTTSDINGRFTLTLRNARKTDSIFISYMGYETISTTVLECMKTKTYELKPFIDELMEVTITSKKLNLKKFIKEVITGYNKNKRKKAHIAIAHYREKAKENNEYIMFMESIGYSVFAKTPANAAPLSNYNFFYENTKSHVVNAKWTKYKRDVLNAQNVAPGGGANLNIFRSLELYGLLSNKHYKKYNYKKDSTYYIHNTPVYQIRFDGNNAKGAIHVYADTKQILKIECSTTRYWSTAFHKRVDAQIKIQFNYFEKAPFISKITANYQHEGLEYQNYFEVLVQKFNNFDLSNREYWSMNGYDKNPYVKYTPKDWKTTTIEIDKDYDKIVADLASNPSSLEQQFENSSGRWFFPNKEKNELAVSKIKQLKENF